MDLTSTMKNASLDDVNQLQLVRVVKRSMPLHFVRLSKTVLLKGFGNKKYKGDPCIQVKNALNAIQFNFAQFSRIL